jgi:hypothetical protein
MLELFVVTMCAIYWLPFMVAAARRHRLLMPILVANGLVGWTGAGWLIVMSWALLSPAQSGPAPQRAHLELVRG